MRYPNLRHAMLECLAFEASVGVQAEELETICGVFESYLFFTHRPILCELFHG